MHPGLDSLSPLGVFVTLCFGLQPNKMECKRLKGVSTEIKFFIFKEFPNGIIRRVNMKPLDTIEEAKRIVDELTLRTGLHHYWMEMSPERQSLYPIRTESRTDPSDQ